MAISSDLVTPLATECMGDKARDRMAGVGGGGGPPPRGGGGIGNYTSKVSNPNNWHIDRKAPKNSSPWDGWWETYKSFREMTEDHMVSCNPARHNIISLIEKEKTQRALARIGNKGATGEYIVGDAKCI